MAYVTPELLYTHYIPHVSTLDYLLANLKIIEKPLFYIFPETSKLDLYLISNFLKQIMNWQ